jgi:FAD/FMN-containing dehydrogenase/Fe-S oxidoreductase
VDEQQRERIRDDLKGVIQGELLFDDLSRTLYATDASIFQVLPLGIAVPRDEEDVQTLVRYAAEHHLALIPRGAGTGLAGEALGAGLIVDLSRHFRGVLEIASDTVRVQPGVVYQELNRQLAQVERRFAPDPASGAQCTIGGMLATNASGAHALRYGYTRDHVTSLRVVLDTGDAVEVSRHPHAWSPDEPPGHLADLATAVADLLGQHGALIDHHRPRTRFNRCGYQLHDVLDGEHVNLARLLVGSEGTLAFFTEATLRTVPLACGKALVLLGCDSLDAALAAARRSLATEPAACELIDHRLLTLARGGDAEVDRVVPPASEVVLLIEYESATPDGARQAADELLRQLRQEGAATLRAVTATDPDMIARIWKIRGSALTYLYALRGRAQPVPLVEDIGVPVEELPGFLRRAQEILQRHETTAAFLIRAGTGQIHTRPFIDLDRPKEVSRLWAVSEEIHGLALELGGTISTQHGIGLARTPWVARQYGPLYPVLRQLKAIFDPQHLFNPGKIVGEPGEWPPWSLRRSIPTAMVHSLGSPNGSTNGKEDEAPPAAARTLALRWEPEAMQLEAGRCNGCGLCRTEQPPRRMCPIFRATLDEAATPRAKANLMRHVLGGTGNGPLLSSDEVRAVADLCVNCKMCARECPAHVNIPQLMLEAKAANVAEHGLTRPDWVLARTESFAAFGSAFALFVNAALASRPFRWLLELSVGVSRQRRLPTFAARNFLDRARRRGLTQPPRSGRPRVAYFVDVFANYNDPQTAEATVAVLRHQGFDVYVPPGQIGSGMAPLAQGDVDTAREAALRNLRVLGDLVREGYRIICSEPTAALMLRQEYPNLIGDPDAQLVAEQTVELTTFLDELHRQGRLRTDLRPLALSLGHHVPCHLKALGGPVAGPRLLRLIPGLSVRTIDVSCSGMAGTFGLRAENYQVSLQAGRPMLDQLKVREVAFGSTECSACRLQMEDGAGKRTLHPVQYLALAYGLTPELSRRLRSPLRSLVLQ